MSAWPDVQPGRSTISCTIAVRSGANGTGEPAGLGEVLDHIRRRKLERAYLDELALLPEAQAPSPETRALLLETLVRIDRMLDGLNAKAKAAFLMSRLDGLTYPDIAATLRVSVSSVEKYMAAAIRHCYELRYG